MQPPLRSTGRGAGVLRGGCVRSWDTPTSKVPLQAECTEELETERFTRRKIYVRSEEDYWIPAYLFLPKPLPDKAPAVVCLHGHSGIYPYIRDGTEEQLAKSKKLDLDFARTSPKTDT